MERIVSALETHRLSVLSHDHVAELLVERVGKREFQFVVVGAQQSFEGVADDEKAYRVVERVAELFKKRFIRFLVELEQRKLT